MSFDTDITMPALASFYMISTNDHIKWLELVDLLVHLTNTFTITIYDHIL